MARLAAISLALMAGLRDSAATPSKITIEDFMRLRCGTGGQTAIMEFSGTTYSNIPQEKQRPLFGLSGMNVARCFQDDSGDWWLSSREIMYYTDLETGQPIHRWHNPWTNETLPVVHVAN